MYLIKFIITVSINEWYRGVMLKCGHLHKLTRFFLLSTSSVLTYVYSWACKQFFWLPSYDIGLATKTERRQGAQREEGLHALSLVPARLDW
jgi:4-hydroxybenzoate polyprenyltransferase